MFVVPEAARPLRDRHEPNALEVAFAMQFPIAPRVRMPIQRETQRADRVMVLAPLDRPELLGCFGVMFGEP